MAVSETHPQPRGGQRGKGQQQPGAPVCSFQVRRIEPTLILGVSCIVCEGIQVPEGPGRVRARVIESSSQQVKGKKEFIVIVQECFLGPRGETMLGLSGHRSGNQEAVG